MSRIGNRPLSIPEGVTVELKDNKIIVKGPKGELTDTVNKLIEIKIEDNILTTNRKNDSKKAREMHGTSNANVKNMFIGVTEGFSKGLEIVGVGYRFNVNSNKLAINAGFSHPVELVIPEGLTVESISNTEILVKGISKFLVGEFAAKIREKRKPEPYKGKGIKYKGEHIRRKEGKKAS